MSRAAHHLTRKLTPIPEIAVKLTPAQQAVIRELALTSEQIECLDIDQIEALCVRRPPHEDCEGWKPLTYNQVMVDWWSITHTLAHEEGYPYATYQGLTPTQLTAVMNYERTREEVDHPYWSEMHNEALAVGVPYKEIADKEKEAAVRIRIQLMAQRAGVPIPISKESWITDSHLSLIKSKFPLEIIADLDSEQCIEIYSTYLRLAKKNISKDFIKIIAIACFGLTEEQASQAWVDLNCLNILKKGINYSVINALLKKAERQIHSATASTASTATLFAADSYLAHYSRVIDREILDCDPTESPSLSFEQSTELKLFKIEHPELAAWEEHKIIAMACFGWSKTQAQQEWFSPEYLALLEKEVSYKSIETLIKTYRTSIADSLSPGSGELEIAACQPHL